MNEMNNYTAIDLIDQNLELSWSYPQTSDYIIAVTVDVTAQKHNGEFLSLQLPNAREGFNVAFYIRNISGGAATPENNSFYLVDYTGLNILGDNVLIIPGDLYYIYLTNLDSAQGVWQFVKMTNGSNALNNFSIISNNNSLLVENGNVSASGQSVNIKLPIKLVDILNLSSSGYISFDQLLNQYYTRIFTGDGVNININNQDGIAGNTQISLNNQIAVLSINCGTIFISGNTIEASPDNNINLATSGIGKVNINGVLIDTAANVEIANNLIVRGNVTAPGVFIGQVTFYETQSSPGVDNQIIILTKSGIIDRVEGSNGIYSIIFNQTLDTANYNAYLQIRLSPSAATPLLNPYSTAFNTQSLTVYCRDQTGNILPALEGFTVGISP